jgi:hypothetical protein
MDKVLMDSVQSVLHRGDGQGWSATSILIAALAVIIITLLWRSSNDRLASFSGPPLAAWTPLYSVRVVLTGREHEILREMHDRYGKIPSAELNNTAGEKPLT